MVNQALIAELEATYRKIDVELKAYSEKANANDRTAGRHLVEAERLQEEAHALVRKISEPSHVV